MGGALVVLGLYTFQAAHGQALPDTAPVPADNPMTPAKIELGKKLYFDPRLSVNGTISCNSCHNVMGSGDDGRPTSMGHNGKFGGRNSPTVFNAAFMSVQFWDGRAASLEEQAKGPMTNPVEMGMPNHTVVIERLKKIPGYAEDFRNVFARDLDIEGVVHAIAAYERTLITPNSPYDRFLKGEKSALSAQAQKGMKTVEEVGCLACHSGPNFAGPTLPMGTGFYMRFPVFPNAAIEKKYAFRKDKGRMEVTNKAEDRDMWRVPTWRNVATTAPYFHNGAVKTLSEAVKVMAKTQLNRDLTEEQTADIVEFLKSLTGTIPPQTMPMLPAGPSELLVQK
jgi:cytochrome c peroxidase